MSNIEMLETLAEQGNLEAQAQLGLLFLQSQDISNAKKWFERIKNSSNKENPSYVRQRRLHYKCYTHPLP